MVEFSPPTNFLEAQRWTYNTFDNPEFQPWYGDGAWLLATEAVPPWHYADKPIETLDTYQLKEICYEGKPIWKRASMGEPWESTLTPGIEDTLW